MILFKSPSDVFVCRRKSGRNNRVVLFTTSANSPRTSIYVDINTRNLQNTPTTRNNNVDTHRSVTGINIWKEYEIKRLRKQKSRV